MENSREYYCLNILLKISSFSEYYNTPLCEYFPEIQPQAILKQETKIE